MEQPERNPWGRRSESIDQLRNQPIGIEDRDYVETVLKMILEQLVTRAKERHITFTGSLKSGLPGVLTIEQAEGDVSQLLTDAEGMAQNVNALEETKNRNMQFDVDYVPVSQRVPKPAIVISGMTSR